MEDIVKVLIVELGVPKKYENRIQINKLMNEMFEIVIGSKKLIYTKRAWIVKGGGKTKEFALLRDAAEELSKMFD